MYNTKNIPIYTTMLQKYWKYILSIILAYAIFLRFYKLWEQSFWIDEGFSSYTSLVSTNMQYYFHNLSQQLSFWVFGISDWSARVPSVIFNIINIGIIWLIATSLFRNKYIAVISVLLFCFSAWEITWARQARFYTLLQLLFSINIYLLIQIYKNFSQKYLYFGIIFLYIWIIFHPFLWASVLLFIITLGILLFKNRKNISLKNTLLFWPSVWVFSMIVLYELFQFLQTWNSLSIPWASTRVLSDIFLQNYINNYNNFLVFQYGILYSLFMVSMVAFVCKRKILKSIIFVIWFLFTFFIISQKGYLFHTRYLFILAPLVIIGASYSIVWIWNKIKNIPLKYLYYILITWAILISTKLNFFPHSHYYINYTSPQPNFQWAYDIIPKWQKIISGFPMLCEWYYDNWQCLYSLPINYVWDEASKDNILARWKDNYTNTAYLKTLDTLELWEYYFVVDELTARWWIYKELLNEVVEQWESIYNHWERYNTIEVIKYIKN